MNVSSYSALVLVPETVPATIPEITEREWRARTLEAAALEIEVRGWTQNTLEHHGKVCALGAIVAASGYDPARSATFDYPRVFGHASGVNQWLATWNDKPTRTAEEVTFLLRWRAEEIRDGL